MGSVEDTRIVGGFDANDPRINSPTADIHNSCENENVTPYLVDNTSTIFSRLGGQASSPWFGKM